MDNALLIHRLHFAYTVTFHYLFPQLTMGLAPLIVVLKTLALRHNDEVRRSVARNRLLEWHPGEGWDPICERLGLVPPSEPFPHVNTTDQFRALAGLGTVP